MKAIATIALISAVCASEDNEFFRAANNTGIAHHNFPTRNGPHRPIHPIHPIHHNATQNVTVKPKPMRQVRPVFNKNHTQPTHKSMRAFDDEELFFNEEIASNEFNKGVGKFVDRNKEWIAPVANKVLDKLLSKFDVEDFNEDELSFLGSVGKFFKRNGPVIGQVGMKVLPALLDDEVQNELGFLKSLGNVAKKAGGFVVQHPQLVTKFLDDEQAQNELGFLKSLGNVAKKAGGFVVQHPQLVTKFLDDEDQEFFNLNTFLNDAIKTYNDAKAQPRNYGNLVNDGIQLVKDIKQKKQDDEVQNELGFLKSLGNVAKKAGGFVVQHPQVLAMLDDEEAENELGFLKSLGNVAKKAGGFVVQHPQLVTKFLDDEQMVLPKKVFDPKTIFKPTPTFPRPHPDLTFDDEELFSLKDNIHRAEQGAQVAKHYIYDRIEEIKESLKKHDDEELVNLGQLISEGLNTFGNAKKYEELVNDGLKTVQEVKPVSHVKKFMRH